MYQETVQTGLPSATQHEGLSYSGLVSPWPNLLSPASPCSALLFIWSQRKTALGSRLRRVLEVSLPDSRFLPL